MLILLRRLELFWFKYIADVRLHLCLLVTLQLSKKDEDSEDFDQTERHKEVEEVWEPGRVLILNHIDGPITCRITARVVMLR